ncbi:hypothetical protein GGR53DRAFT_467534 [Hypoxylon sp. FL1150]|nr:hypothetical protein GGR53DRAFT_467534 [Hypoxylon sp. FL1150]
MTSLYDAAIVPAIRAIKSELTILAKAEEWTATNGNGVTVADLLGARIYEDMYPASIQIVITAVFALKGAELLTGRTSEPVGFRDRNFEECRALLADSLKTLEGVKPEEVNGKEDDVVAFAVGKRAGKAQAKECDTVYVHRYLVPTLYFHLTTLYDILRMKGVPLGKLDFLTHYLDAVDLSPPL